MADKTIDQMTNQTTQESELREALSQIIKAPMRSQVSTSDIVVGMWSSTALAEKIGDIMQLIATREAEVAREAQKKGEGIGAYIAISHISKHVGYLLSHRANGQYGETTSEVIHDLWVDMKKIQDENDQYMRTKVTLNDKGEGK